jgi:hypothetical protein
MSVEHVVFFPAPDGSPAFRRLPSLDEVVAFVEHLRNERDVHEVSVHSLTEVPLAFKTVYRVEVSAASGDVEAPPAEVAEPVAEVEEPVAEPVAEVVDPVAEPVAEVVDPVAEPVDEPVAEVPEQPDGSEESVAADGHSLGFFAT